MNRNAKIYEFFIPPSARSALAPFVYHRLLETEKRLVPQMRLALENYMIDVVTDVLSSGRTQSRTGTLAKSLLDGIKVTGSKLNTIVGVYRGTDYAVTQEYGGKITPKRAKVLTLPLPDALRPDGTPKLKSPRSWKRFGTFSYTSKKTGQGYLVYRKPDGSLKFLYVYVDVVNVKPTLGLRKTHNDKIYDLIDSWLEIIAYEMANVDLMSVVDNPDNKAKLYNSAYVVAKKFRPKAFVSRRR